MRSLARPSLMPFLSSAETRRRRPRRQGQEGRAGRSAEGAPRTCLFRGREGEPQKGQGEGASRSFFDAFLYQADAPLFFLDRRTETPARRRSPGRSRKRSILLSFDPRASPTRRTDLQLSPLSAPHRLRRPTRSLRLRTPRMRSPRRSPRSPSRCV